MLHFLRFFYFFYEFLLNFLQIIQLEDFMKKKELNIWQQTNEIYKDCKCFTLLSSFVVYSCIFVAMFFPLGFGIAFFLMSFLCIGFKKNVLDCLNKKTSKVENVFAYYKNCISAFCLKVCSMLLVMLWSLLFIVPGIIAGLNYSFAPYIFAENVDLGTVECLNKSKEMTINRRGDLFLLYLSMTLFICLVALFVSSIMLLIGYFTFVPLWLNIVVPIVVTLFVHFVFILPYFELLLASMYLEEKKNLIKNSKQKNSKSASNID